MLPTKFGVNWLLGLGEEAKSRLSPPWQPSWISNRDYFSYFMLPTKFKVNKPFNSGEEAKNRFSRWPPWQTSWISDQKDFSYF